MITHFTQFYPSQPIHHKAPRKAFENAIRIKTLPTLFKTHHRLLITLKIKSKYPVESPETTLI